MRSLLSPWILALLGATALLAPACGAPRATDDAAPPDATATDAPSTDAALTDAALADAALPDATATDAARPDAPRGDTGGDAGAPMISEVLECGRAASAGGLAPGSDLQRHTFDPSRFPDALCNDGTPAVIYFRPHEGDANRNHWVIQLQGGGGCRSGDSCAARWCSVDTNFGMTQMTSRLAPMDAIDGAGILARRADNPLGGYNHVFVRYCSSDMWSGAARDAVVSANHPTRNVPVTFRAHFLGARILDAVLATLRRDGAPGLTYDRAGTPRALPDLDDAAVVVFAGASAGGAGVITNADRVAALLRGSNTACARGGACPLRVAALIDSSVAPSLETLDVSNSTACGAVTPCTYEVIMRGANQAAATLWRGRHDESCVAWHAANRPGTEWQCADNEHVVHHHVTTPMFLRTGQSDELLTRNYIDSRFALPGGAPIDVASWGRLLREQLAAVANIQRTAHEGAAIPTVPAVFSPSCAKHETLRSNPDTFDVRIDVGGTPVTMFDTFRNWASGAAPSIVITPAGGRNSCP